MISESVLRRLYSVSAVFVNSSLCADDLTKGVAVMRMRYAMRKEARGSQPDHGIRYVSTVEAMTDALPSVSARIWR